MHGQHPGTSLPIRLLVCPETSSMADDLEDEWWLEKEEADEHASTDITSLELTGK